MAKRPKKTLRDFNAKVALKIAAIITVIGAGYAYAGTRYTIGLDTQDARCLNEWFYVIDTWRKPTAAEIRRDDYVAVRLTAAQTPRGALWQPGQVMVKRAEASQPGDVVTVTEAGVQFRRGADTWRHGTGLEAARMIGSTPEAFERTLTLEPGQVFLMGDHQNSYDGRYYGPVSEQQIVGRVVWAF